jgi:flagellar M-ring protein FliF
MWRNTRRLGWERAVPEFLKSMGVMRIGAMAGVTAALFGFFAYIVTGMSEAPMSLLYAGLDAKDSSAIITKLEAAKVPYKLEGDGSTILVASDKMLRLRMDFAGQGMPSGGNVGYEIFDSMDAFGQTSFVQNVNMVRALEGELSRTIRSLDSVDQARVHLVIPKKELFAASTPTPTASVVLRSRSGRIGAAQVQAIQNLVASAVNGLSPQSVTVVDERGVLLASGHDAGSAAVQIDDRASSFEERLRQQVENLLTRVVGPGRARVQVSAEMDFAKFTRSSEKFDPDGQVIRSTQSVNQNESDQDKKSENGVSVANALPAAAQSAASPAAGASSVSQSGRTEETVNYEISKTTETQIQEAGMIKRLSVAVVVDGVYTAAASGERTYAPRRAEEMKEIEQLVRSSIGYDEKRGDQIKVTNLRFSEPEKEELVPDEKPFLGLEKGDIWKLAQFGGLGALALIMIFFVFRPLVRAFATPPTAPGPAQLTMLPSGNSAGASALQPAHGQHALPNSPAGALPAPMPDAQSAFSMIDISQVDGQVKESSVKKVGEIITKHPEEATAIMRQWLHESA